jgi:membrane-associated phospholipid phosphatase
MPRRAAPFFAGAVVGIALLLLTWFLAFHVGVFERADQSIFRGFADFRQHQRLDSLARFVAGLCNGNPYIYFAAAVMLIALARGGLRVGVTVGAILLGANVTTQLLKPLLAHPRADSLLQGLVPVGAASWPSGHATAAMSLALCSVLAASARWRPLVAAIGAAFAVAVSYSFLTLGWHYPSDVFGGFLVALIWTLIGVGAMFAADARKRRPVRAGSRIPLWAALTPPVLALSGAIALAGLVALARPHDVVVYARAHEAFLVGAAAIGSAGLVLATGLMLALRR